MAILETAAQSAAIWRLQTVWPLAVVGFAVIVNAAWIGLLNYGVLKLIQ